MPPRSNAQWLEDLQASGARHEMAVADLREYLLRAVVVYLTHHRSDVAGLDHAEIQQLAEDWAQQGVLQVLDKLPTFRGDSKFTTWAYRVIINLVAGDLRHKRWGSVSLEGLTESESPDLRLTEDSQALSPEAEVTRAELWTTIQSVFDQELTDRQRSVLTQVVLEDVPVETVAEQLGTNRNNIYKIVHDARRKLRHELELRHWSAADILAAFEAAGGQ